MGFFADIWYDKCNAWGEIVQGDWIGHRIIPIYDDNSALGVLTGSGNKIYHDCSDNSYKSQGTSGGIKNQTIVARLSSSTIERYVEVGNSHSGPNAGAFIAGTLTGGALLGAAAAMSSVSSTTDIAVYMKNGKKFIIHFFSQDAAQKFKQLAFSL